MSFTRPEGVAIVSKATEPTTRMLMNLRINLVDVSQQAPSVGNPRRAAEDFLLKISYFKYFPTINCSFSFVADGILSRSVRIACANADPHLHDRVFGIEDTRDFTTLAAFSAFLTKTATIWSTVTES